MKTMLTRIADSFVFADVEEPNDASMAAKSDAPGEMLYQTVVGFSGWPLLVDAIEEGASLGDVEPVVGPDGTLLLCRESTGECIEWPSG